MNGLTEAGDADEGYYGDPENPMANKQLQTKVRNYYTSLV